MIDPPSIDTIQRLCAAEFGVTVLDVLSHRRDTRTVIARHVAMLLTRVLTHASLPAIGRRFGDRDHSTVLVALRSIRARIEVDTVLAQSVADLRRALTHAKAEAA